MQKQDDLKALSKLEFAEMIDWVDGVNKEISVEMRGRFKRILAVYLSLTRGALRAKQTLHTLRQAMGIIPKSEKGSQDKLAPGSDPAPLIVSPEAMEGWSCEQRQAYAALSKKRNVVIRQKREYDREIKALKGQSKVIGPQYELELVRPNEMLFTFPLLNGKKKMSREWWIV